MTWAEKKLNIHEVYEMIIESLKNKYQFEENEEEIQFKNTKDVPFIVYAIGNEPPWNFLVIEYEDTGEDGDSYYPEDYECFEDMFQAMLAEIEG